MSHNKKLDIMLAEVSNLANQVKTEVDFNPIFERLKNFQQVEGKISYDNSAKWLSLGIIVLLGGAFAVCYFYLPETAIAVYIETYLPFILGGYFMLLAVPLIMIAVSGNEISSISDVLFNKDVFLDNRLQETDIKGKEYNLYGQFRDSFGEFRNRGDENRYIQQLVRGTYDGDEITIGYDYYVFHFVRVYYVAVTHTSADGKSTYTTMERRTETLHRYGLITDFGYVKNIAVVSGGGSYDYPAKWEAISEEFCKNFSVCANDEITAAKFLKPTVVLAFNELRKHFRGLNVEVNAEGKMNIAFSDSNVLSLERKSSIASPGEFENEILSHLGLPKLNLLMTFIETLTRFNDSNFENSVSETNLGQSVQ